MAVYLTFIHLLAHQRHCRKKNVIQNTIRFACYKKCVNDDPEIAPVAVDDLGVKLLLWSQDRCRQLFVRRVHVLLRFIERRDEFGKSIGSPVEQKVSARTRSAGS